MTMQLARQYFEAHLASGLPAGLNVTHAGFSGAINTPEVLVTFPAVQSFQASFGSPDTNMVRNVTVVFLELYVDGGAGTVEAYGFADSLMDLFRNERLSDGYRCGIPYIQGARTDEPYFILNIAIPYIWDDFNA